MKHFLLKLRTKGTVRNYKKISIQQTLLEYLWLRWVFVAAHGLSRCRGRGLLFVAVRGLLVAVRGLLIAVASLAVEHGP